MSEMIMRVARAISEADGTCDGDYRKLARAAIEAMREPTQNILDCRDAFMKKDDALAMWRTMIDSALKDPPHSQCP